MKDYSQFIPNSFGFITKYEIIGEKIYVYTTESKKGEPHDYPLTADWLRFVEKRLETQYQLVIENRAVIEEYFYNKLAKQVHIPMFVITAIAIIIAVIIAAVSNPLLSIPAFSAALLSIIGGNYITNSKRKQFAEELNLYQTYLENRKDIEDLSCADPNITKYLSDKTTRKLQDNKTLVKKELTDTAFTVEFMDTTSLKNLKKLLSRYMISKSLLEEQTFSIPKSANAYLSEEIIKNSKKRKKAK